MQRPIMNPSYLDNEPAIIRRPLLQRLQPLFLVIRFAFKILFYDPLRERRLKQLRIEDGTPWQRFCRGLLYRLAFLPLLTGLGIGALVYSGTHPGQIINELEPSSQGIYYEPVTFRSDDGVRIEAWLIPVFEAKQILRDKEEALRQKHPAVLLLHDYGQDRQQMLPLLRPIHEAGFVVMAVALRGAGASGPAGVTFGLRESNDVKAALATLRRVDYVDPMRIGIVGVGTGGNAALLAASDDVGVTALVLDHPAHLGNQQLIDHLGPHFGPLNWLRPMCKWTFELFYQVDAKDMDLTRFTTVMNKRRVLMIDQGAKMANFNTKTSKNICRFLSASFLPAETPTANAGH